MMKKKLRIGMLHAILMPLYIGIVIYASIHRRKHV